MKDTDISYLIFDTETTGSGMSSKQREKKPPIIAGVYEEFPALDDAL